MKSKLRFWLNKHETDFRTVFCILLIWIKIRTQNSAIEISIEINSISDQNEWRQPGTIIDRYKWKRKENVLVSAKSGPCEKSRVFQKYENLIQFLHSIRLCYKMLTKHYLKRKRTFEPYTSNSEKISTKKVDIFKISSRYFWKYRFSSLIIWNSEKYSNIFSFYQRVFGHRKRQLFFRRATFLSRSITARRAESRRASTRPCPIRRCDPRPATRDSGWTFEGFLIPT